MASLVERESSFCDKDLTNNISRALYSQKEKAMFCDIIMRICGTEMFAHSAVLAAASPYFSTFLSQDLPRQFSQRCPQIIEIQIDGSETNITYADAVTSVIDFIYTGVLQLKTSTVMQVSELARIMQLGAVLQFCEDFILNVNNPTSSPSCANKTRDMGMNTDDPDDGCATLLTTKLLASGTQLLTTGPLPSGAKPLFVQPPGIGPQKLFKAGKLVSTSTQVTPTLLGILPPPPTETKHCKTQTLDKDFPSKGKPYTRAGRRRQQYVPVDDVDDSEIVVEIKRAKLKPTSVRIIKEELTLAGNADMLDSLKELAPLDIEEIPHIPNEKVKQPTEEITDSIHDTENDDLHDLLNGSSSRRRSGRKRKPTPKIIALRYKGVPFGMKQAIVNDSEEVHSDVIHISKPEEVQLKSPRKAKLIAKEDCLQENLPAEEEEELMDTAKQDSEATLIETLENKQPETEEKAENPPEQDVGKAAEVVPNLLHISRLNTMNRKRKAVSRLRRGRRQFMKFVCTECNFQTNKVREFACHKRLHKMESNICYYCEEKFDAKEELNEHFEKHKGPLPYFCVVCDCRYKSKTQLNIHLPKHSADKPFVCEICSTGFKWKHALKNHMIVHSNRKDHLCDECGYATAHKCQLKAHKLIHTGETFRCQFQDCRFQATKRQNLKYHLLTHTREKPHQCEICGQSFSLIKNMRRHMLLHSSDKPHHCDQCDFSTTRYDKLKEHMLKLHGMGSPPEKRIRIADLMQDKLAVDGSTLESDDATPQHLPLVEEGIGVVAPLVASGNSITVNTDDLIRSTAGAGLISEAQTVQFFPGQTIYIMQTGHDGKVQTHEVTIPVQPGLLETGPCEQVTNTTQFTEVMISNSQLNEYVQELAFVPPTQ